MFVHRPQMPIKKKILKRARQLSLFVDELGTFVGRDGWTLMFKETKDGQLMAVTGKIEEVYDALDEWKQRYPEFYSAVIYSPNGSKHRTIK